MLDLVIKGGEVADATGARDLENPVNPIVRTVGNRNGITESAPTGARILMGSNANEALSGPCRVGQPQLSVDACCSVSSYIEKGCPETLHDTFNHHTLPV
jgi:hypothetical protein